MAHCAAERWVCRSILQTQSYKAAIECRAESLTGMRIRQESPSRRGACAADGLAWLWGAHTPAVRRRRARVRRCREIQRWTTQWALEVEWKSSYKDVCAVFPPDFPNSDLTKKEEESVLLTECFIITVYFKIEELRSAAVKVYLCFTADFKCIKLKYISSYFWGRLELWKKKRFCASIFYEKGNWS